MAARISKWLDQCENPQSQSHHACCHHRIDVAAKSSPLPTRVLKIRGPQSVRLHTTAPGQSTHGLYACLSYCWGNSKFIRTTSSNVEKHQSEVPWRSLPKTFQEALELTARLGLYFLWIDSLCVIQDDPDDWRHESAKMASIYTNSYITLAAAKSSNPIAGLLGMNCYRKIAEIPNQQGPPSNFFAGIDTELMASSLPLLERAWVFQERVLSPRVVYLCAEREYWECKSGNSFGGDVLRIRGSSKEEMKGHANHPIWYGNISGNASPTLPPRPRKNLTV